MRSLSWSVFVCSVGLVLGCGGGSMSNSQLEKMMGSKVKEVVPVSGKVLVDGAPQKNVTISLYAATGDKPINTATTDAEGKYCWTNYRTCDGLEPGEYRLTFTSVKPKRSTREPEDAFNGKYGDPAKTEFELTVEKGKPQKDVNYELTK